jgi:hypothetical protein
LEIHNRVHCRRASHRVGGNLRQRDVADIAGHHEIGDGSNRVLDGDRGIEPSRPIDVDVVHAKPLQRIGDEIAERGRTIVGPIQTAIRITQHAKLNAENRLVTPPASECLADQHLVVARPVKVGGIQQIDSSVERSLNRRDALSTIR